MRPIVFTAVVALASAVFSVAASAQTGAPSAQEVGRVAVPSAPVEVADAQPGSYARYLMLNGKTRDEAIEQARNVDHPAEVRRFAWHRAKPAAGAATTRQ